MKPLLIEWWVKRMGTAYGAVHMSGTYQATDTTDALNRIDDIMNDPDFVSLQVSQVKGSK